MSETEITVRGRLGFHPELQVAEGKKPWLRLRVATNRRIRNGDVWTDGPTSWYDVKLWGDFARNVAESVTKGDAVIVQGEFYMDEYQTGSGVTMRTPVIHARAFGPDLRLATARVTRVQHVDAAATPADIPDAEGPSPAPWMPRVDVSDMQEVDEVEEREDELEPAAF